MLHLFRLAAILVGVAYIYWAFSPARYRYRYNRHENGPVTQITCE